LKTQDQLPSNRYYAGRVFSLAMAGVFKITVKWRLQEKEQMFSHTVPKKLLEQFAYKCERTKSLRLWQYHKGRAPWWKASPGRATAWEGHFADPDNKAKEAEIELRLKQEFEDPVNDFLESIGKPSFQWNPIRIRLLTGWCAPQPFKPSMKLISELWAPKGAILRRGST
jgi:hypothetical protein